MTIDFLALNINTPSTLIPTIIRESKALYKKEAFRDFEPEFHRSVTDYVTRPNKQIPIYSETEKDEEGNFKRVGYKTVFLTRLAMPFQKIITARRAVFLAGGGVVLKSTPVGDDAEKVFAGVTDTWESNKLNFKSVGIANAVMSQLECVEVWYSSVGDDGPELKCRIYKPDEGYIFYPVWDENQDLIAFGIEWVNGRNRYFNLYTDTYLIKHIRKGGAWVQIVGTTDQPNPVPHNYGKMPVIYYCQPRAAWLDVQTLIDRVEKLMSIYGDVNDYSGNPTLFLKGEVDGDLPGKEDAGKTIVGIADENGNEPDAKYISIDSKPEMVIFEKESLVEWIFSLTQTPDISFAQMKGLGDISGAALERMLIDAYMKATEGQLGWFGEAIQRRLNFLKAAVSSLLNVTKVKVTINPHFNQFIVGAEADKIDTAMKANGGQPVMTHEGSIAYAGTSDTPVETAKQINDERAASATTDPTTTNTNVKI